MQYPFVYILRSIPQPQSSLQMTVAPIYEQSQIQTTSQSRYQVSNPQKPSEVINDYFKPPCSGEICYAAIVVTRVNMWRDKYQYYNFTQNISHRDLLSQHEIGSFCFGQESALDSHLWKYSWVPGQASSLLHHLIHRGTYQQAPTLQENSQATFNTSF